VALLFLVLVALAFPAGAAASRTQETLLQDDPKLVFSNSNAEVDHTLATLSELGVDRIRVSVFWDLFGPDTHSKDPPIFEEGADDPGSYDPAAWERYDRVVRLAAKHSIAVLFNPSAPAPAWAAARSPGGIVPRHVKNPDPAAFRDFIEALGKRYDGTWPDPHNEGRTLPRVDHWSIWNEPGYPSWLWPQWRGKGRSRVPNSPRLYRRLVDAAYTGLRVSGHADDTFLLGETSPGGSRGKGVRPVEFVRELYCLNRRYQPYQGRQARRRGCPTTAASRARFTGYHPGLFNASGWAHHAYSLHFAPTFHHPDHQAVTIGDIPRLTRTIDRSLRRWGAGAQKPDVWITEHGWQTDPPDPYSTVTQRRQALWINQADFLMSLNPRVASVAQFLLYDDRPRAKFRRKPKLRKTYWGTWQSGLLTSSGQPKPAFDAYRLPLWVARFGRRRVRVWAQYRPGGGGAALTAGIEFLARGGEWTELAQVPVADERGMLDTNVDVPGNGAVRVVWTDPAKDRPQPTRAAAVKVRP
jgi:hypothetical protein